MGLRNSKENQSHEVKTSDPAPQAQVNSEPPAPPAKSEPEVDHSNLVPKWLNESQFEELLTATVDHFSKIVGFRVKPAMAPGENYATLMLRISIDVELTDKSTKLVSLMMKVPHDTPQMEQMMNFANFFTSENAAYTEILPKMEALYKAKGLDIKFAPRAFKLDDTKEPKLANTVLMHDLGQNGFKNLNRLECLNLEQTKFALTRLAQFHAAGATMVQVHGPYPDIFVYGMMGNNKEAIIAFMDGMLGSFRTSFLANLNKFKNGEDYRAKLEKALDGLTMELMKLGVIDPTEFNALNHGDCWMNNLLFKMDSNGALEDMVFVDFQNPKYGTPAMDLLYFIMTSVQIEYKLDYFDFFIRHYHEQLLKHLDILGFTGRKPSLRELHRTIIKYGGWVLFPTISVLPVVLLDPTQSATFDNFMSDSEAAVDFRNALHTNKRYQGYIERILPWLDNRGFLEASTDSLPIELQAHQTPHQPQAENADQILEWLNFSDFKDIILSTEPNFDKILSGTSKSATKPGDNFASKLLKVDIDAQLKDKSVKTFSYILKVHTVNDAINLSDFNLFPKEIEVYSTYVPSFERLYKDVGLPVSFSAKSFRLSKDVSEEYLILENLQPSGFKMGDRLIGMDLEHTKCTLKKLAQWHAASLKYKELNGPYPPKYNNGIFTEQTAPVFKRLFAHTKMSFMEEVAKFEGVDEYLHKIPEILNTHVDRVIEDAKIDEEEFNVLNHGDAWINNIMFQYDFDGRVKETLLLDHQVTKYGNPAQDLYYFIMSSTQLDVKVDQFDYLIRWYHENLEEHAKLLNFNGFIPSLKELHVILMQHPIFAVETVLTTLSMCLNKTTDDFTTDSFLGDDKNAESLRAATFSNERYRANIERIMPWLNRRGLLDYIGTENSE
ncbi:uncharacterized protein LOC6553970 [Drosophila erecta]|uniref:GG17204 n=1 Tax=Drosophila erecta TaxID=7220 RepID=B3P4H1_DROER|nr:uncharacterized protein LOC6553970 [Drosophila erecta]EDV49486.1 uncharacterized protein Dere_GG17204 [Drosophila erecta]